MSTAMVDKPEPGNILIDASDINYALESYTSDPPFEKVVAIKLYSGTTLYVKDHERTVLSRIQTARDGHDLTDYEEVDKECG